MASMIISDGGYVAYGFAGDVAPAMLKAGQRLVFEHAVRDHKTNGI
jgi:hypothetical protein